jgi:hypothetical protein
VHQRASHLRALLDALDDVDMSIAYELHYYPYAIVELLRVCEDAPPTVLRSAYVSANRQWERHSEFTLRVVEAALQLVHEYRADPSMGGARGV